MRARFAYPLLFLLPSAMAAGLVAFAVGGAFAGMLWLYAYGDNRWPDSAGVLLAACLAAAFVITLAALVGGAYAFGRQREAAGGLAKRHIVLAAAASLVLPAIALLHQWKVGNLG